ncbi:MAG: hypothetical protein AABZ39_13420 [Spirochaetota bacterium]
MKAPYKVLFSNDTTGLSNCKSPYNPHPAFKQDEATGEWIYNEVGFSKEILEASVDETAGQGIDVHLLQPGVGWVPWWKSRVYPFAEHIEFMKERTGMDPSVNAFAKFMADGGDMVDVFVNRCRNKKLTPFISMRLNDSHGHEYLLAEPKDIPSHAWHCFSKIHIEHPDWRISRDIADWNGRVLNWAIPEVVDFKYSYIEEICEQYDIDGFELDFMRHNRFFDETVTPLAERRRIMNAFIRRVRMLLDRTAKAGRRRWLCVRVPAYLKLYDDLGIHLPDFVREGVDMVNASYSFFTEQQGDIGEIRTMIPEASLYVEMCHTTSMVNWRTKIGYDAIAYRRTTARQYWTTAHLAYARGADGMSTFNFQYYREHGTGPRGPFHEPPFSMHKKLGDPSALASEPQHNFIGATWYDWAAPSRQLDHRGKISTFLPGETKRFELAMAPPKGGWKKGGILRIQSPVSFDSAEWDAVYNGVKLARTDERGEPYDNPYPNLLGDNEMHRAFILPASVLRDGFNTVDITYVDRSRSTAALNPMITPSVTDKKAEAAYLSFIDAAVE